jgi:hypothetical protein
LRVVLLPDAKIIVQLWNETTLGNKA